MAENNTLYHYCSMQTAIEYILPELRLLLNPMGNTNDPRENKSFSFAISGLGSEENIWKVNREISDEIRRGCKILCFAQDYNGLKGYEYSRLWALYGQNHKGVCLEINGDDFLLENQDKIDENKFKAIEYENASKTNRLPNVDYNLIKTLGIGRYVREHLREEYMDYFYFRKNDEWHSENEKRLLHYCYTTDNVYCSIRKSLRRVILGVDFNELYNPSIRSLIPNIEIKKASYWSRRISLGDIK
ncbi:DUF2971 domain-containing protein [Carboxylicivirga marina]|uniref:DUF2971 domain-containing protein n=1 Tax=Carboxylicivirga marina TaxID=2800988 RepID=A0ABS1HLJ7_9BACT|nr:DUF2971 domain-containing protein [Carboxylicivirga marina]MBK3518029.1 DUF2971 domain-containing protein [Carboxylicivirga marina]